ncbi:MAG: TIGR00266 family protein [Candidatus Contendobacter odensis]|uniref:TIGR00266 family protein n=1 Tax=Candidatus Contendibacter odensensis TaxID=1400860 RepID=A0A2G6PF74_9GAMM|nr:MAG: TIGR00266 family protein [Candidatus Contendobacter odensis]
MTQWYLSFDGQQIGPMDVDKARAQAMVNPEGQAWHEGLARWTPICEIPELKTVSTPASSSSVTEANQNAIISSSNSCPRPTQADEVDYFIHGQEMQFVEIELDPEESAVAEAGAMMYKDSVIQMETIFGDGSHNTGNSGFMAKLLGAGKRLLTGESLFMTVFTHAGHHGKARVAFAAPFPGHIIPISLANMDGRLICQKDSFLCAARGVSIGIHFQKRILTGLFGGEGFIMQKLEGDGLVFVHAGGTLMERQLDHGETLHVDTGCLVAMQSSVDFDVEMVGGIKSTLFGGEGLFFATLRGPGHIWLQSLPFSRLAGRMLASAPQAGGSQGEGSILGGILTGNR